MAAPIRNAGRFLVAGGQLLTIPPVVAPPVGGATTSIQLTDYYTTWPTAYPVLQRKAGTENDADGGKADVPVLFTYVGALPALEGQVVKRVGGAIIKDWTAFPTEQLGEGYGFGRLPNVTAGEQYLLKIRVVGSPAVFDDSSVAWGVGVNVFVTGQSNQVNTLNAGAYDDPVPGSSPARGEFQYWQDGNVAGTLFTSSGWAPVNGNGQPIAVGNGSNASTIGGGTSYSMRVLAKSLEVKHGKRIPVGWISWAWNSNSLAQLAPSGGNGGILFNGSGTTAGTIGFKSPLNIFGGDFEVASVHQGEAGSSADATYAGRMTDMGNFTSELHSYAAQFNRSPAQLTVLFAVLGAYQNSGCPQIEMIRRAALDFAANSVAQGWKVGTWNIVDHDTVGDVVDGLHPIDTPNGGKQYRKIAARRQALGIMHAVGAAPYSAAGPKMSSVTRNQLVATVTVAHNGGTTLVSYAGSGAITGFSAVENVSGTVRAPTIAVAGANTFTATFPAGTVFPVTLTHCAGQYPDVTNLLCDDADYPRANNGSGINVFAGTTDAYSKIPLQYGSLVIA